MRGWKENEEQVFYECKKKGDNVLKRKESVGSMQKGKKCLMKRRKTERGRKTGKELCEKRAKVH